MYAVPDRRSPFSRRAGDDRRFQDRREVPRLASDASVRFLRVEGERHQVLSGELLDASPTGVRLLLDEPLAQREKLIVEVRSSANQCVNLTAQVVWCECADQGQFKVGCALAAELTDRQYARLNQIATARRPRR